MLRATKIEMLAKDTTGPFGAAGGSHEEATPHPHPQGFSRSCLMKGSSGSQDVLQWPPALSAWLQSHSVQRPPPPPRHPPPGGPSSGCGSGSCLLVTSICTWNSSALGWSWSACDDLPVGGVIFSPAFMKVFFLVCWFVWWSYFVLCALPSRH